MISQHEQEMAKLKSERDELLNSQNKNMDSGNDLGKALELVENLKNDKAKLNGELIEMRRKFDSKEQEINQKQK